MVVGDQGEVDPVGQVFVGVAGDVALVGVAEHGIEEDAHARRLDQDAGVAEVAPPHPVALVGLVGAWRLRGQQPGEPLVELVLQAQRLLDVGEGLRHPLHLEQLVDPGMPEGPPQLHVALFGQPRRAEDERPVVPVDQRQHQALGRLLVMGAAVEQRLDEPDRGLVVEVVDQLHEAPQPFRDAGVERLEGEAPGLLAQQVVELLDGRRELEEVPPVPFRPRDQLLDLRDPRLLVVDEGPAQHGRVLHRGRMDLRRLDVGLHDLEVPAHDVHGQRGGRDQVRPRVPTVDQRLHDDVGSEVQFFGSHSLFIADDDGRALVPGVLRSPSGPMLSPPYEYTSNRGMATAAAGCADRPTGNLPGSACRGADRRDRTG